MRLTINNELSAILTLKDNIYRIHLAQKKYSYKLFFRKQTYTKLILIFRISRRKEGGSR